MWNKHYFIIEKCQVNKRILFYFLSFPITLYLSCIFKVSWWHKVLISFCVLVTLYCVLLVYNPLYVRLASTRVETTCQKSVVSSEGSRELTPPGRWPYKLRSLCNLGRQHTNSTRIGSWFRSSGFKLSNPRCIVTTLLAKLDNINDYNFITSCLISVFVNIIFMK